MDLQSRFESRFQAFVHFCREDKFYYFSSTATFAKTGYNSDNFPEQIKLNIAYIKNHSLRFSILYYDIDLWSIAVYKWERKGHVAIRFHSFLSRPKVSVMTVDRLLLLVW